MIPAAARRQLMSDFHEPVQQAVRDAAQQGVGDATMLLLDLRDERAQKMAADVADLDTVRNIVATAEEDHSAPILVAYTPSEQAAALLKGHSRKAKRKFATQLPTNRFRIIVVGSGGITWAVGAVNLAGPVEP
jgi:hypothetical protein